MPAEKTYTLAAGTWPRCSKLVIESTLGTPIAKFPLNFLESCGDNTWAYVSYVVSLLVVADPDHPGAVIDATTGGPVDESQSPRAGTFQYIERGKNSEVSFAFGPTSASSVLPAAGVEVKSSINRSRHSTDQSEFRQALLVRDNVCLVTGNLWQECQASHIVPWSRTDVYTMIDGDADENYSPKAGLLLDARLHHEFDALKWSLYYKNGVYYVHMFNPMNEWRREFNGKTITSSAFHGKQTPPDPKLTAWHYAQTVMARVRGYSRGFAE